MRLEQSLSKWHQQKNKCEVSCPDLLFSITAHEREAQRDSFNKCHLHTAEDINRLRLQAVACAVHVENRHSEVDVHAQLAKIFVAEHFQVRRQEILQK